MVKWKCTQRTEKERFAIVRELKAHPEWSYNKASKILGVKKSTLINYEKQYWEKVDTEDGCDQLCKRGGGRKHHQKPYEARVLENYDTCLREGANSVDCGIYLMHYMKQLSRRIAETSSPSIVGHIEKWTTGSFNSSKADQPRISFHARILQDATVKTN
eukprot:jgi/Phyca11/118967/e_gw1.37.411.1